MPDCDDPGAGQWVGGLVTNDTWLLDSVSACLAQLQTKSDLDPGELSKLQ